MISGFDNSICSDDFLIPLHEQRILFWHQVAILQGSKFDGP